MSRTNRRKVSKCATSATVFSNSPYRVPRYTHALVLILFLAAAVIVMLANPIAKKPPPAQAETGIPIRYPRTAVERQQAILNRLPPQPVSSAHIPVHIYRNGRFFASGTQMNFPSGPLVLTAEHLFAHPQDGPAYYSYRPLYPKDAKEVTISSVGYLSSQPALTGFDIAGCRPGSAKPIKQFSRKPMEQIVGGHLRPPRSDQWFTCLTDGKRYQALLASPELGQIFLNYQAMPSESGTGFVSSEGQLLILAGSCEITDQMKRDFPHLPAGIVSGSYGYLLLSIKERPRSPRPTPTL